MKKIFHLNTTVSKDYLISGKLQTILHIASKNRNIRIRRLFKKSVTRQVENAVDKK